MKNSKFVQLDPTTPLPCAVVLLGGVCGQPATEADARLNTSFQPVVPGAWVVLPICPTCKDRLHPQEPERLSFFDL